MESLGGGEEGTCETGYILSGHPPPLLRRQQPTHPISPPQINQCIRTYDFAGVVTCATVVYGFAALVPVLLWAALRYMATPLPLIEVRARRRVCLSALGCWVCV